MHTRAPAFVAVLTLVAAVNNASAQLVVNVGAVTVQENSTSQVVDFTIQNTSATAVANIFGLDFALQVDSGTVGPKVTGVDLTAGTSIFSSFSANQANQGGTSWTVFYGVDTGGAGISLPGNSSTLLARVTFDTTGLSAGSGPWNLALSNVSGTQTEYILVGAGVRSIDTINNGTISVVPEPASYGLFTAMALLGLVGYRKHSARSARRA